MKRKKTTRTIEISIKTDEHLVIKQRRNVTRAWCTQCGKETEMIRVEELRGDLGEAERRTERSDVHFLDTGALDSSTDAHAYLTLPLLPTFYNPPTNVGGTD